MAKATGSAAPSKDDFDGAFSQFSAPDEGAAAAVAAEAVPAPETAATGAASGGNGDGSGDASAAAAGSEPGAAGDAAGDGGAAAAAGSEVVDGGDQGKPADEAGKKGAAADKSVGAAGGDTPAAEVAPAAGAPAGNVDEVLTRLSKLVAEAKPAEAQTAETKEEPKPVFTEDERAQLGEYDKDWPDVSKFEAMKRRGEYQELMGFIFGEVQKYVQPLMETLDALAGRAHLADVKAAVPDYSDSLRKQVVDWVANQPAYLQTAYNHVIQNGTHDEVKDLVERYRVATGQTAPAAGAASTGGQVQSQLKDNELSGAAKEAAAALAPVESKRSEVLSPGDPSSFEDAWSQFSKDLA